MHKRKLLLLIENRSSERLLTDCLCTFDADLEIVSLSQQNVSLSNLKVLEMGVDLIIADLDVIARYRDELIGWKQRTLPLSLPVLLLAPEGTDGLPLDLRDHIDALLYKPINPIDLEIATKTLLRARQLFNQLQQQRQELSGLSKSNAQFTAMVAHEFRNPLSLISSLTQLIRRNGDRLSQQKRDIMLERIQAAVSKLTSLVDSIIAFNRNPSTENKFSPSQVDLAACCIAILNDFEVINKGMYEISFQVKGECSDLYVDADLITTILTNLLSNALKYSPDDSPVSLRLERKEGQLVIEVRDNGKGIPTEDQPTLFDAFFRARNAGAVDGTGLGLSIVKQCVTLHGGHIELQSEAGRGTTFKVILPLDVGSSSAQPLSVALHMRPANESKGVSISR